MEAFTALKNADEVRTFPNIDMPAPVSRPHNKKKALYEEKHKQLFNNNSTGPMRESAIKLPGLLRSRKTRLEKDKPIGNAEKSTFTGFNSTHFKLDMDQSVPAAYENMSAYKTVASTSLSMSNVDEFEDSPDNPQNLPPAQRSSVLQQFQQQQKAASPRKSTQRLKEMPTVAEDASLQSGMLSHLDLNAVPGPRGGLPGGPGMNSERSMVSGAVAGGKNKQQEETMIELRNYITLMDKYSLHNFMIYEGRALQETPEFQSFKRTYQHKWGAISGLITQMEEYLNKYDIKLALINGPRMFELSKMNIPALSKDELHSMIQNIDQIEMQMENNETQTSSQIERCVIKLQTRVRAWLGQVRYKRHLDSRESAIKIQSVVRRFIERCRMLQLMKSDTFKNDLTWSRQRGHLESWWKFREDNPQEERQRLVVIVPSITAAEYQRMETEDFHAHQNTHVSLLYLLADPDVTVLYITPFVLTDSDKAYHDKFLSLQGISLLPKRLYFICPEMINKLPPHLSLSMVLWCSPGALNKIRTFMRRFKFSTIIPTTVSWVERRLSSYLNINLFTVEPGVSEILSSRSFMKNTFMESGVNMPVGSHDIFGADDMFIALSRLIASNIGVCRWLIRLNNDSRNLSIAFVDVERMSLVLQLRREQHQLEAENGNVQMWFTRQMQLSLRKRVINMLKKELVTHLQFCRPDLYPNWEFYLRMIRQYGAVIEAEPIEKLGTVEGICCISPSGEVQGFRGVEAHANDNYQFENYLYPQNVIPDSALKGATEAIAHRLFEQHRVVGYFCVQFVCFWDAYDELPRMWAVSMQFGMGCALGALGTAALVTTVPPVKHLPLSFIPEIPEGKYVVYVPIAVHDPLKSSHDDVFFKLCRMRGVAFDILNRVGSLFFLIDSVVSGAISIICIGATRKKSLELAIHTLGLVSRDFGMDSETNPLRGEYLTKMLMNLKKMLKRE